MRINAYQAVTTLNADNVLIVDGSAGTKTINAKDAGLVLSGLISPEQHRIIFRGKNLGAVPTADQLAAIQNGSFTDLFLGDYWVNGGINYRIADFDYWQNTGDSSFSIHHLVIVPDTQLSALPMEDTNTTINGYYGSKMRQVSIPTIITSLQNIFGSSLKTHREYLSNASTNGKESGGSWYDSVVDLMQESQVYGGFIFKNGSDGTTVPTIYTINKQQFALFAHQPKFVHQGRYAYWLRDIVSGAYFAFVTDHGSADSNPASASIGVRPCFAIG